MNRFGILSEVLMNKFKLSQEEADGFVAEMFKVIEDALKTDKQVKVKGLGIFKLTMVNARESVDVNTGERIVIESREKINFTPDNSLSDLVNSPFAQFETVLLNEGVDFSEIDTHYAKLEKVSDNKQLVQQLLNKSISISSKVTIDEPISVDSIIVKDTIVTLSEESRQIALREDIDSPKEQTVSYRLTDSQLLALNAEVEKGSNQKFSLLKETDEGKDKIVDNDGSEGKGKTIKKEQTSYKWHFVSAIILLFVAIGLFIFVMPRLEELDNKFSGRVVEVEKNAEPIVDSIIINREKFLQDSLSSIKLLAKKEDSLKQAKKNSMQNAQEEKEIEQKNKEQEEARYNKDIRVKTGAYRIVGVLQTIIVKQGQTLSSISRKALGPNMECYVEVINGKKEVREGDKIKIPLLELKKKRK